MHVKLGLNVININAMLFGTVLEKYSVVAGIRMCLAF
jgi:hypothetical protein